MVTNVGYAHVEFFDSIEGVAAAKRELIEGAAAGGSGRAERGRSRAWRGFARRTRAAPSRSGFPKAPTCAPKPVEAGGGVTRFRALGVDYETPLTGRHAVLNLLAALAVARLFGVAPERLREAVRTFAVGSMRGEKLERNGMVVWNDCYNSNPEAAQSMIDVLRETPARRRIAVLGEMLELGHAAEELHRKLGVYAARQRRGCAGGRAGRGAFMVEQARAAGLPDGAAVFFEDPETAGEFARAAAAARRCDPVQRLARSEGGAGAGEVSGRVRKRDWPRKNTNLTWSRLPADMPGIPAVCPGAGAMPAEKPAWQAESLLHATSQLS